MNDYVDCTSSYKPPSSSRSHRFIRNFPWLFCVNEYEPATAISFLTFGRIQVSQVYIMYTLCLYIFFVIYSAILYMHELKIMLRLSLCVLLFSNNKTRIGVWCMVLRAFSAYCIILAIIFLYFHMYYTQRGREKTNGKRDIHPESETNKPIEMQHDCYKYTRT